tara:strand:+ start:115 stop:1425 length:1311 start_codon:yes stop_codon:yes gene_type:complete
MIAFLQITICFLLFGIYLFLRPKNRYVGFFLIDSYLLGVFIYAIGSTYVEFFLDYPASHFVAEIARTALMTAIIGAILFLSLMRSFFPKSNFSERLNFLRAGNKERACILLGMALCALVMLVFVVMVFRNDTVATLLSIASITGDGTLTAARKMITNGSEGYFAPGYIKQFRDILPPILLSAFMLQIGLRKWTKGEKVIYFSFFILTLFADLVSGQRSVIFILFLTISITNFFIIRSSRFSFPKRPQQYSHVFVPIFVLIVLFGGMSILLGRMESDAEFGFSTLGYVFTNLFDRIFLAAVIENINAFSVWSSEIGRGGMYWVEEIGRVLPGNQGQGLSNELANANGGSAEGNSPLGLPADLWFTWGWSGILVVPALYAMFVGIIDIGLHKLRGPLTIGARIYLMILLPFIPSPYGFILYGGVLVLVLMSGVFLLRK